MDPGSQPSIEVCWKSQVLLLAQLCLKLATERVCLMRESNVGVIRMSLVACYSANPLLLNKPYVL